ncbi:MAG: putative Dihydroorotate dehydrogenase, electron transfer subunit [candidate division NC10 bacterium]|nr:putative Dihydroorotate dehydrogenase, electron transfer subunit [candidate division NC10 bacterium]
MRTRNAKTALLAAMRPGRFLRALGPLGNAFEVPRSATGVIMVAGGIGVPPIAALAESLAKRRTSRRTEMTVFLGGRSKADLLCAADFRRAGAKVHMATEDGSSGYKGLVTEAVEEFLRTSHLAPRTSHSNRRMTCRTRPPWRRTWPAGSAPAWAASCRSRVVKDTGLTGLSARTGLCSTLTTSSGHSR